LEDVNDDLCKIKVKKNGEEWKQVIQTAEAHPELQGRGEERNIVQI
jgi:hypothetical protein